MSSWVFFGHILYYQVTAQKYCITDVPVILFNHRWVLL